MEVLVSALRHGGEPEAIQHALDNALAVDQVDEDPDRYLVLGPDQAANLLELVVLDRLQAPPSPRHADATAVSTPSTRREMKPSMTGDPNPTPTDADIEQLADDAERGYDVDQILERRRSGRPPRAGAAGTVESVRLDPDLKRDLLLRAARDHTSVSDVIRRAIGEYLHAS